MPDAAPDLTELATLDRLFTDPLGDGLFDGPLERGDEPRVAGQADFASAGVDLLGEIVGQSQVDMLRHSEHNSIYTSNGTSDSVNDMTTTPNDDTLWTYDGDRPVKITKKAVREWKRRVREAATMFGVTLELLGGQTNPAKRAELLAELQEWANEAAGAGSELQCIAEATSRHTLGPADA